MINITNTLVLPGIDFNLPLKFNLLFSLVFICIVIYLFLFFFKKKSSHLYKYTHTVNNMFFKKICFFFLAEIVIFFEKRVIYSFLTVLKKRKQLKFILTNWFNTHLISQRILTFSFKKELFTFSTILVFYNVSCMLKNCFLIQILTQLDKTFYFLTYKKRYKKSLRKRILMRILIFFVKNLNFLFKIFGLFLINLFIEIVKIYTNC